jgi:hypothetical protein
MMPDVEPPAEEGAGDSPARLEARESMGGAAVLDASASSPPPSSSSAAPAAAPAAPRASTAGFACSYLDQATKTNLSDSACRGRGAGRELRTKRTRALRPSSFGAF